MVSHEGSRDVIEHLTPVLVETAAQYTDNPRSYEQSLETRICVEEAVTEIYRQSGHNSWSYAEGDYRKPPKDAPEGTGWRIDAPLSGLEKLWSQRIDELLPQKKPGEPILVVDFGGGFGTSLIRVAAQEKYQQAIERGDLILAATNLGYLPSQEADESGYTAVAKGLHAQNKRGALFSSPENLAFIQAHQGYVQFLDTNVMEFSDASVPTANGNTMPLKGNIDILSEWMSVAHTHTPDLALGVFAESMNQDGTLYLHTFTPTLMEDPQFEEVEVADGRTIALDSLSGREYCQQRKMALEIGISAARSQLGLEVIQDSYLGPTIFRKQ